MLKCGPVAPRRIGIVTVARSDRGHLSPLIQALGDAAVVTQWPALDFNVDLVVIFGDRWEFASHAAYYAGRCIPIAHLHAGERTEAVIDDACRWAISEMATWRITANESYRFALIQRGYRQVFTLGAPGLARLKPRDSLGGHTRILVAFHPETKNLADIPRQVTELVEGIADIPAEFVITEPGLDAGREHIMAAFRGQFTHYTDDEWLTLLAQADVLVGNSSCGIIETPSIPLPSVNIGDRQKGRLMSSSVICVPHDRQETATAIQVALDPAWRARSLTGVNRYGDRGAAQRIAHFLKTVEL